MLQGDVEMSEELANRVSQVCAERAREVAEQQQQEKEQEERRRSEELDAADAVLSGGDAPDSSAEAAADAILGGGPADNTPASQDAMTVSDVQDQVEGEPGMVLDAEISDDLLDEAIDKSTSPEGGQNQEGASANS